MNLKKSIIPLIIIVIVVMFLPNILKGEFPAQKELITSGIAMLLFGIIYFLVFKIGKQEENKILAKADEKPSQSKLSEKIFQLKKNKSTFKMYRYIANFAIFSIIIENAFKTVNNSTDEYPVFTVVMLIWMSFISSTLEDSNDIITYIFEETKDIV